MHPDIVRGKIQKKKKSACTIIGSAGIEDELVVNDQSSVVSYTHSTGAPNHFPSFRPLFSGI